LEIGSEKLEDLSKIEFISEKNESLKNVLISSISEGNDKKSIFKKINSSYKEIIEEIYLLERRRLIFSVIKIGQN